VVDIYTLIVKLVSDTPVSITAMMLIIYRADTLPDGFIAVGLIKSLGVIIER
jgi:hypothetical protein